MTYKITVPLLRTLRFPEIKTCARLMVRLWRPWSGILSDTAGHVRNEHGREFGEHISGAEVTLQNFNTAQRYWAAIFLQGKLFYLVWEATRLKNFHYYTNICIKN